jgi:DNA uptake protein ComE-like DNA-binding protein
VPDDAAALTAENERLKAQIDELEKSPFAVALPSDAEVRKLLDSLGKMVDQWLALSPPLDRQGTI